ncbi:MAG: AAA family ATPase [Usitatibacter sp.]
MTMYLDHFGLREAPFRITPHTEFFFGGANRGATLEALLYAITAGEGMVKVTGEVGTGKTMLCRVLMERLPDRVETIYLAVPSLSRDEMLAAICGDLGIDTTGSNTNKMVRALQDKLIAIHSAGRQVVALIDEAHAMPLATLEEIRLLSNLETNKEKLLQIVLFGQPELDQHLALAHMRQLKERITHSFTLGPLPPREIDEYVKFRLRAAGYHGPDLFGPEALRVITDASEGLTRRINIYADKTLLAAFAAGTHTLTADHARAAITDTQIVVTQPSSSHRTGLAVAAALVIGAAIGFGAANLMHWRAPAQVAAVVPAPQVAAVVPAPQVAAAVPAPQVAAAPAVAAPAPLKTGVPEPASPPPPVIPVATPPAAPAVTATVIAEPTPAPAQPAPAPARSEGVAARLAAGRTLLRESASSRWAVQLMVTDAREREYLETWLVGAGRTVEPGKLLLVPAGGPEGTRVGVLFGTYPDRAKATEALAALPANLRQFKPYVRSIEAIREDTRRVPAR